MPDRERALDVVLDRVADHHGLRRLDRRAGRACARKIVSCGFVLPCTCDVSTASADEPVVGDELVEVARRVREQADLEAARREGRRAPAARRRRARSAPTATSAAPSRPRPRTCRPRRPCPTMIRSVKSTQISSSWSSSGWRFTSAKAAARACLVPRRVEVEPVAEPELPVAVAARGRGPGRASVKSTSKTTARSTPARIGQERRVSRGLRRARGGRLGARAGQRGREPRAVDRRGRDRREQRS